jgi:hypothetical protein
MQLCSLSHHQQLSKHLCGKPWWYIALECLGMKALLSCRGKILSLGSLGKASMVVEFDMVLELSAWRSHLDNSVNSVAGQAPLFGLCKSTSYFSLFHSHWPGARLLDIVNEYLWTS